MTLERLEIARFGKFTDTVIELASGLDERILPNEYGKSTLADFIVFCFYGFDKSRAKRELADNPSEKYRPWDREEEAAGGIVLRDDAGRAFRVERTGGKKGRVLVLDGAGAALEIGEPGQYFFGVDKETFLNIFFMREGGGGPKRTAQTEVAMKNLVVTGDETVSYEDVRERLRSERAQYGSIKLKRLRERVEAMQNEIVRTEQSVRQLAATAGESPEKRLEELDEQIKALSEMLAAHRARAAYGRQQKRAALRRELDGAPPEEQPVSETDLAALGKHLAAIEQAARRLDELPRGKSWLWLAAVGLLIAPAGAPVWPWNLIAAVPLTAVGIALWLHARRTVRAAETALDRARRTAEPLFVKTGVRDQAGLERLIVAQRALGQRQQRARDVRAQLDELAEHAEQDARIAADLPAPALGAAEAERRLADAQAEKARLLHEKAEHAAAALNLLKAEEKLAALRDTAAEERALYARMCGEADVLDAALAGLEAAQGALQNDYAPLLCTAMSKHLAALTAGKYDVVTVDPELNVRIKAAGGLRELGYFSAGTRDAAYLALRFSLADIVEKNEPVPMILDDPFLAFDEERLAGVRDMLARQGRRRQILFFTCRN